MKKAFTLRSRIILLMALLLLVQGIWLLLSLYISDAFFMLDAEAFSLFTHTTQWRADTISSAAGNIAVNIPQHAEALSSDLVRLSKQSNSQANKIYLNDRLYEQAVLSGTDSLLKLLSGYDVTGAFFMLNQSNVNKSDTGSHSAVYIRNSTPGIIGTDNYLLALGSAAVSRGYTINRSHNLVADIYLDSSEYADFYNKPVAAVSETGSDGITNFGYWSPPFDILGDNQPVVVYTVPLVDDSGNAFGVLGVEISVPYFVDRYLPNSNMPYQNIFYSVGFSSGSMSDIEWIIPGGALAQTHLTNSSVVMSDVSLHNPEPGLKQTTLEPLGEMYCSVTALNMYGENSSFADDRWSVVGFVPQNVMHESSANVRSVLILNFIIVILLGVVSIFLLAYFSTRKISHLSKYIEQLAPFQEIEFDPTGMREIDDLTSALKTFNHSIINSSKTTSKILALTLLPIGGFEISEDIGYAVLTEFVYSIINKKPGSTVSKTEWAEIYKQLTAFPAAGYENIYKYEDSSQTETKWLRILSAPTETGMVGVILDVSKDLEEHRRLAHELDYDALTHLYNRTAFKREAYMKILGNPNKVGAMIFSDLDNLKYINDTYGHDTGDRLIVQAGDMFRQFEAHGAVVSRISGDEFAMYLHGYDSVSELRDLVEKQFREYINYHLDIPDDGSSQRIRSSSGLAWYPDDSDNITDLLKLSDFAMYEAKHTRKGSLLEFSRESYDKNIYLLENREAISKLIDDELINFAFQPIVDARTGQIFGYEMLMRPMHESFNSPKEILSVAAAQSKLGQLERLVMFKALQAAQEQLVKNDSIKFFINSIPSQILNEADQNFLETSYFPMFKNILFEITEEEHNSPQQLSNKVSFMTRNGIMIAIDDFGAAHSNDIRINPNIIKVDMSTVQQISQNPDKQKLMENLIEFYHPKNIKIVAEGVEEYNDLAKLIELGVDYVQGYYLKRPAFELEPLDKNILDQIHQLNEIKIMAK